MLDSKQRLIKTLKLETVDRAPCICPGGMMNNVVEEVMDKSESLWPKAHQDAFLMAKLAKGVYNQEAFENYGVPFCMTIEAEAMGAEVFLGSKLNEPRVIKYPINKSEQWSKLKQLNAKEGRVKVVLDAIKILHESSENVPIVGNLVGPVSIATSVIEPMVFYKELRKEPGSCHKLLSFIVENLVQFGNEQIKAGADVITISEPSGTGEILGPKFFKEFSLPYLNMLTNSLNAPTIVHICGRLSSVFKELDNLSCNSISFDSITSVEKVTQNVKDKAIMGNLSTYAIEYSEPRHLQSLVKRCLKDGVDIVSPACGVGPKSKLENLKAIVQAVKESKY
ncbi:MtaA/CmuA family methyltransferase [Proteinivorax tanatarense]|uniref:MtaA/CmuA family methyltransferase n=1 Tax=Proteinivorax tanatarense TaxID=1260629 RepID=A0AAU7VGZ8_9FIRM